MGSVAYSLGSSCRKWDVGGGEVAGAQVVGVVAAALAAVVEALEDLVVVEVLVVEAEARVGEWFVSGRGVRNHQHGSWARD